MTDTFNTLRQGLNDTWTLVIRGVFVVHNRLNIVFQLTEERLIVETFLLRTRTWQCHIEGQAVFLESFSCCDWHKNTRPLCSRRGILCCVFLTKYWYAQETWNVKQFHTNLEYDWNDKLLSLAYLIVNRMFYPETYQCWRNWWSVWLCALHDTMCSIWPWIRLCLCIGMWFLYITFRLWLIASNL